MNAKEVKLQKFHHSLISHSSKEPKVGKSIKAPRNSNIVTFSSAQKRQHAIVYSTNLIVGHSTANTPTVPNQRTYTILCKMLVHTTGLHVPYQGMADVLYKIIHAQ